MADLHPSNPYYSSERRASNSNNPYHNHSRRPTETETIPEDQAVQRSASLPTTTTPTNPPFRTRSIGYAGIIIERPLDLSPPNDAEIIIATVRLTTPHRLASQTPTSHLPTRPPRRNFLRRLSTRVNERDEARYTAVKMPRGEYKKFFARDAEGRFVGTAGVEGEWTEEELERAFGRFQGMALRSVPGEEGEGEGRLVDVEGEEEGRREEAAEVGGSGVGKKKGGKRSDSGAGLEQMKGWGGFGVEEGMRMSGGERMM